MTKTVTHVMEELNWDANHVAALMNEHGIRNRGQLAKLLGINRHTVNDAFDEQWRGRATTYLIATMCSHFRVYMADLVQEPLVQIRRMNSGQVARLPHKAVS